MSTFSYLQMLCSLDQISGDKNFQTLKRTLFFPTGGKIGVNEKDQRNQEDEVKHR